ncbi:MAG: hypothetical protein KIT08_04415 [Anaerolineales bacterium]|nr:MAG: hypothetical protein KIT08_04415 [Anaerolineales bacterium]
MQEARGSYNAYFYGPNGSKDQFTLRQSDEQSDKEFILRVKNFIKLLEEQGWTPWEVAAVVDSPVVAEGNDRAAKAAQSGSAAQKSFELESIQLAAGGEHPRWVVKGGNFKKFGVTCWPEVLDAAGIAEKLDPMKENKPKGRWLARYVERENDEGRLVPDKVVELVKN